MIEKYYNFDYLKDFLLYTLSGTYVHTDNISSEALKVTPNTANIVNTVVKMGVGLNIPSTLKAESSIV